MDTCLEYLNQGEYQKCKEHCLSKIEQCGSYEEEKSYTMVLGHALNGLKEYDESEKILKALLEKKMDFRVLHNLGSVKRMKGEFEEALAIFQRESELNDGSPLALECNFYEQAKTKHMLNRTEEAFGDAISCLIHGWKTDDLVSHGCSYRVLGDLFAEKNSEIAEAFFKTARDCFAKAGDKIAVEDVDKRMDCLKTGEVESLRTSDYC